jgi:hypothetical protein
VVLVETSDAGFYNNSIGTALNLSNTGTNTCAEPFPASDDCTTTYPTAPNLSAASSILGNWLGNPGALNSNWSFLASIPNSWVPNTEVAVIYRFDTLGATNVVASFGVDNGIFVWLDGVYRLGARAGGGHSLGEYTVNIGDLSAGSHYLQLLLEDHGAVNGYDVRITADTFIPGPPPGDVPEPVSIWLIALGMATLGWSRRNKA